MSNEDTTIKQHRGLARCRAGHGWPCLWWVEAKANGAILTAERRVEPLHCPAKGCGKKWETITNPPSDTP